MLENGYFVNSKRQLYAIVNGSMYSVKADKPVKVAPGYYDEDGEPVELEQAEDADFNESDHPRGEGGKFTSGGGSGHADKLFKAGNNREQFNEALASLESLPKQDLFEVAREYRNKPTGANHPYKFNTKTDAIDFMKKVWLERASTAQKFKQIDKLMGKKPAGDEALALDRASVRELDQDGRLGVEITNISKANVCPYLGREIPGMEELGLEPDKVYYLLRDPKELAKAAPTFCNLPVLSQHIPVFAEDYAKQAQKYVVGSTGSDCVFQAPFLRCSMKIWDGNAIQAIQTGEQKELSCGYHYKPVMKPGIHEGAKYDGVMVDIIGNHVALVREGRAGADVVVGDSKENLKMAKKPMTRTAAFAIGVLAPYVKSKLAADKGVDLRAVLCGLTASDIRDRKPAIITALKKATRGKLAKDTTLGEVAEFLDMLEAHGGQIDGESDEPVQPGMQSAMENTAMLQPEEGPPGGAEMGAAPGKPGMGAKPGMEAPGMGEPPPEEGMGAPGGEGEGSGVEEDDDDEELKMFLKGKLSEEDFARVCEMLGAGGMPEPVEEDEGEQEGGQEKKGESRLKALGADPEGGDTPDESVSEGEEATDEMEEEMDMGKDNPPDFKGAPKPGAKMGGDKKFVTQDEMQKAMRAAAENERKTQRDIRDAEKAVQPWVGNLAMTFDSAEQVYRKALKMLGVRNVDNVHASALPTILDMQPKPGARKAAIAAVAQDESVKVGSFFDRYPDAGRIRLS